MRRRFHFVALACWLAMSSWGSERTAHWRIFPAGELPTVSVTISPRGRVIARQGDGQAVSILDGYATRQIGLPEGAGPRIHESRSGQLWATYPEGLLMFQRGQWTRFPIPEVRQEFAAKSFANTRAVSLVPADVNRVFFLLPDRLMQFNSMSQRSVTIRTAAETRLGQFSEMLEAPDGLVVAGARGVAHVAGPIRHINATTPWREFSLDASSSVEGLQRPFPMADGGIMTIGFDRENAGERHLLVTAGTSRLGEEPLAEKLRLAWAGWAGTRWGLAYNGVYRYAPHNHRWVREGGAETYFDAAVQTNGVFWLATSAGLVRYAPLLWRAPGELAAAGLTEAPCLAMTAGENNVWIATADGLLRVADGRAERFAWPDQFEPALPTLESLHELPDGGVLIGASEAWLFHPGTNRFAALPLQGRVLGTLRSGEAAVRVAIEGNRSRIDRHDGIKSKPFLPAPADSGIPNEATFMVETRAGDLWFGGPFGLARFRQGDAAAQLFGAAEGLFPERIQCLAEVGEDKLWAGGVDSIFEWRGARWERIKTGVERVRSIQRARDGHIWVGSFNGVHRYVGDAWLSHDEEEGLPSLLTHHVAQDRRGRIWAATSRGAVQFFPEADPDEPRTFTPTLVESDFEEDQGVNLRLSGADKWNYTASARLLFAYRLDEGTWSDFTNVSTVSFRNLSAGPHYLQARAMDRNGKKDPSIASLEFAITAPWFRDPRLIGVLILGLVAIAIFAGLAVNAHWRLRRSYAEVERMVAERTAQLEAANQELLHSQKMRALGTLAAGIAHDFNNILSVIKGSAQIIEKNPADTQKVLTRIDRIKTVVDQGAGIVRSMLGLGKVGDMTECDPAELVKETIRLLGDRFPPEVQVVADVAADVPKLTCSQGVIHQILLNLILNAVDACDAQGTIILRARIAAQPGEGVALAPQPAPAYLAIEVVDRGAGIAPEVLPRIFEPFYTTKGFSSRRGTGLGLSMVYELAKGLGYGLAVQSKVGAGSTFTLLAPLP